MQAEKDLKKAAGICLESTGLDPDFYRLGHTKARTTFLLDFQNFSNSTQWNAMENHLLILFLNFTSPQSFFDEQ